MCIAKATYLEKPKQFIIGMEGVLLRCLDTTEYSNEHMQTKRACEII
jgi:hypothetical protein